MCNDVNEAKRVRFESSPGDAAVGGGLGVVPHVPEAAEEVLAARDHLDRVQIWLLMGGFFGFAPDNSIQDIF